MTCSSRTAARFCSGCPYSPASLTKNRPSRLCRGYARRIRCAGGIDELVESSLLARDVGGHQLLRMLQTVQAFGRERLDQAGLLQTVKPGMARSTRPDAGTWSQQFAGIDEAKAANAIYDELSNLRAAFERALTQRSETGGGPGRAPVPVQLLTPGRRNRSLVRADHGGQAPISSNRRPSFLPGPRPRLP